MLGDEVLPSVGFQADPKNVEGLKSQVFADVLQLGKTTTIQSWP